MGQPGDARDLLGRAGVNMGIKRKDRGFRALHDHDGKAVGELLDGDPFFKRSNVLGPKGDGDEKKPDNSSEFAGKRNLHNVSKSRVKGAADVFKLDARKVQK
jgi:hypothetical protein